MPIDTGSIQEYSDAELLVLFRNALAAVATGQEYRIGDRTLTRANLKEIRETIDWLDERTDTAATAADDGIALVRYGERV